MAMSRSSFRMITAIAAFAVGTAMVDAAEIRVDMTRSGIVLEGKIEAGDFDKLRSYIFNRDPFKGGISQMSKIYFLPHPVAI
jgi:hypothetical protein